MKKGLFFFLLGLMFGMSTKAQQEYQPFYFSYWNGECYTEPSCRFIIEVTDSSAYISKSDNQVFMNVDSTLAKFYQNTEVTFEKNPIVNMQLNVLADSLRWEFQRLEECCLDIQSATIVNKSRFCCTSEMQFSKGNSTLQIFHGYDYHLKTKMPSDYRRINRLGHQLIVLVRQHFKQDDK